MCRSLRRRTAACPPLLRCAVPMCRSLRRLLRGSRAGDPLRVRHGANPLSLRSPPRGGRGFFAAGRRSPRAFLAFTPVCCAARLQRRERLVGHPALTRGHPLPGSGWTPSPCACHRFASSCLPSPRLRLSEGERGCPRLRRGGGGKPPQNRPERLGAPGLAATVAAAPCAVFVLDFGSPPRRPT